MESIEDAVEEMHRLKSKLPPRPSPEDVKYATQTIEKVDANLATRLDQLFQQATPSQVPYHVFRAFLQMREDLIRNKVLAVHILLRGSRFRFTQVISSSMFF